MTTDHAGYVFLKSLLLVCLCLTTLVYGLSRGLEFVRNLNHDFGPVTIQFQGVGRASLVPDEATISLGVVTRAPSNQEVATRSREKSDQVRTALENMGLSKEAISSQYFNLNAEYFYPENAPAQITGYVANHTLNLHLKGEELDRLSQFINTAIENGADEIYSTAFSLSQEQIDQTRKQIHEQAITDAKTKAQQTAKELGLRVDRLTSYYEDTPQFPSPYLDYGKGGGAEYSVVAPGPTDFTVTITASFQMK